ncbi:hypothetical protein DFJ73DRAFT_766238 [Zopfochytrium polystomum]|nr:hypothetical protein DFJ73DRAFT_766238 [Zopfochytrium polystomum]
MPRHHRRLLGWGSNDTNGVVPAHRRRRRGPFTTTAVPVALAAVRHFLLLVVLPALLLPLAATPPCAIAAGSSSSGGSFGAGSGSYHFSSWSSDSDYRFSESSDSQSGRLKWNRVREPSKTGTAESVGGVAVKVGEKVSSGQDHVYHAKLGSKDVIYKQDPYGHNFQKDQVAATKAAGQLIAAQGSRMIQKKVGTAGLDDWLQTQKDNPKAKKKFLATNENPKDHPKKIALSDAIYKQTVKNQKAVGYVHEDIHSGNIRVHASAKDKPVECTPEKPWEKERGDVGLSETFHKCSQGKVPKMELIDWDASSKISRHTSVEAETAHSKGGIQRTCNDVGFKFRADNQLFRRAGGACGGVGKTPPSAASAKTGGKTPQAAVSAKAGSGKTSPAAASAKAAAGKTPPSAATKSAGGGGGGGGRKGKFRSGRARSAKNADKTAPAAASKAGSDGSADTRRCEARERCGGKGEGAQKPATASSMPKKIALPSSPK